MATSNYIPKVVDVEREESYQLIASDKIEGTDVFDQNSEKVGRVHNFMVDKMTGNVIYVVISFGGFLGIGSEYFPIPWNSLAYDTKLGGYVTNVDRALLEDAPRYAADDATFWETHRNDRGIDRYWTPPLP